VDSPSSGRKTCTVCHRSKPSDEFYANKANRGGLSSMCKVCQGIFSAIRPYSKMEKPELLSELEASYRKIGRIKKLLDGARVVEIVREEQK